MHQNNTIKIKEKKANQRKFFSYPENMKEYQGIFIKIVGKILKVDIGMSFISKCYKNLMVVDLLKFLLEKTEESKNDSFETLESSNLQIKNSLIDLLTIFFSKSSQAIQDFYSGTSVRFSFILSQFSYLANFFNKVLFGWKLHPCY